MRAVEAHPRGWDFSSEKMPSVAPAPESVQNATRGLFRAVWTSVSSIMKMMQAVFARSATTRSIRASRGSFFSSAAIWATDLPSYFFNFVSTTEAMSTRSGPPAPRYWFDQASESSSMSFFAFSRCAGSARRFSSASRPPSRIHGGRHASRPLDPAV